MFLFYILSCSIFEQIYFPEEKVNYQQYLRAQNALEDQDLATAISELKSLQERTGSRAILENLADVYLQDSNFEEGLILVSKHLKRHSGDFEIRLMKAKLLLGLERWEEAKGDLQIILFNQKMSLWELIQDPDLQKYRKQPEMNDILGVPTMRLLQVSQTDGGLVGDVLFLDFQVNHLDSCVLFLDDTSETLSLGIEKIRIDSRRIDEWVRQDQIQINWKAIQAGEIPGFEIPIFCGEDQVLLSIKAMSIESLRKRAPTKASATPLLLLPKKEDCAQEGTVFVQFRSNGILETECKIEI